MEILKAPENRICKKCGRKSEVLIEGLCLDCYDAQSKDKNEIENLSATEDNNEYEELQEQYEKEDDSKIKRGKMIVRGQGIKDPHQQELSRQRTISKVYKRKNKKKF